MTHILGFQASKLPDTITVFFNVLVDSDNFFYIFKTIFAGQAIVFQGGYGDDHYGYTSNQSGR